MSKKRLKNRFTDREFCFSLLAIAGMIAFLQVFALAKGIDGIMFGASMTALGAIGGYILKGFLKRR